MKKLILGFALACFVAFGTFGIQTATASADNIEIVNLNLDDDPKKDAKTTTTDDGKDTKECKKDCKKECKDATAKCQKEAKCNKMASKECAKKCNKSGGDKK